MAFLNPLQRIILGDDTTEIIIDPAIDFAELTSTYSAILETVIAGMVYQVRPGFYYYQILTKPSAGSGGLEATSLATGSVRDGVVEEWHNAFVDPLLGPGRTLGRVGTPGVTRVSQGQWRFKQLTDDTSGIDYKPIQSGTLNVSFAALSSQSIAVVFPTPFPSTPKVFTNINTGVGTAARWVSRAINLTTTGFDYFVFGEIQDPTAATPTFVVATWANVTCSWVAIAA